MARKKRVIPDVLAIDIGDKGQTIGRTKEGEIVIINGGCVPGDTIDFLYLRKKKGLKFGQVKEIKSFSTDRVNPQCQHFGICGGCKWQNLSYKAQLKFKQTAVEQAIKRIAKDEEQKVETIVACKETYEYRNKLEYSFSSKRWLTLEEIKSNADFSKSNGLGFHISGAFDKVLQIEKCHLQNDLSNQIRKEVAQIAEKHQLTYYNIREHKGFFRNIIIRNSTIGEWMVTLVVGEENIDDIQLVLNELIGVFPNVNSWNYIINQKMNSSLFDLPSINYSGKDHIIERLGEIKYRISPKSFFQTNSRQAERLYNKARELANLKKDDILYDLYTGTGSIALYMAQDCLKVVGIEEVPEAIQDAKQNAKENEIGNAEFLVGDVKEVLKVSFKEKYGSPDVVITDPPRAGMHADVVETLLQLESPKIVYISCNPSTQARDILLLKEKYRIERIVPVDMFPHTSHIESIAQLILK